MAEIKDQAEFETGLSADQKAFFTTFQKTVGDAAVTKHKTESEAARRAQVPDKYELTFADDAQLADADRNDIIAFAKTKGMTKAEAQEFADQVQARTKSLAARQTATVTAAREQWRKDTEALPEFAADKREASTKVLKRFMDRYAPKDSPMAKFLEETGYGNHPLWVKLAYTIGSAMKEDAPNVGGGGRGAEGKRIWGTRLEKKFASKAG